MGLFKQANTGFKWDDFKANFVNSPNKIKIYEKEGATSSKQTYQTAIEAVVNSISYIEINHCLRILGTGNQKCNNIFEFTKYYKELFGDEHYIVAHDVFGGLFATASTICYLAPDTLEWVDLGVNYQEFINWAATSGVNDFYQDFLWEGAEENILSECNVDHGILIYPFLWAKECNIEKAYKKIVPFSEIMEMTKKNIDLLSKN